MSRTRKPLSRKAQGRIEVVAKFIATLTVIVPFWLVFALVLENWREGFVAATILGVLRMWQVDDRGHR